MHVTLNALRRHLNDRGCTEERVLRAAGEEMMFIEFRCRMKAGKTCRATLAADNRALEIPAFALTKIGKALAACLGNGWHTRIPAENPFG